MNVQCHLYLICTLNIVTNHFSPSNSRILIWPQLGLSDTILDAQLNWRHAYTKSVFAVYLKCKFNRVLCIFTC